MPALAQRGRPPKYRAGAVKKNICLAADVAERSQAQADRQGVSLSSVINGLLSDWLDDGPTTVRHSAKKSLPIVGG